MVIIRIIKCLNFKAKQFYKIVIYMFKIVDYLFEQHIKLDLFVCNII